ncbi:MAG: hypothetical protein Q7S99_05185 [Parvibaculum sp.]|nr:hypothetical protein [Parvibaculum sp.]
MINYVLPFALLTLFTPFKSSIGFAQVRPFDVCVFLMMVYLLIQLRALRSAPLSLGLVMLLPFYAIHVASAFSYDSINGLREAFQIGLLISFAFFVVTFSDRIDYPKVGRVLLVGLICIMLFNIGWHIENGFWSGWKRLIDPKAAFTFLSMLLAVLLLFSNGRERRIYWVIFGLVGVAILFSGERKALGVYALLVTMLLSRGRLVSALPILAIGFFGLVLFGSLSDDPYVARQIRTVLEPGTGQLPLAAIAAGEMPESISDASRQFTVDQAKAIVQTYPVFGIGTNAYLDRLNMKFSFLPKFMIAGVHGEFLRTLVENGVVGFLAYLSIWAVAFSQILKTLRVLVKAGRLSVLQAEILPLILLLPPAFYVGFEASGTRVFVTGMLVSLMPNLLYWGVTTTNRKRAVNTVKMKARAIEFVPPELMRGRQE